MSKIEPIYRERVMYRRAYIGGTFDCLHRGHLALLQAVREIAVETVVSLNTDEFAARYKRHPLMPLADRMAALEACRLVDHVVINIGDEDSKVAIVSCNIDCIVHGDDWQGESLMNQMGLDAEWLEQNGIEMVTVPYTKVINTSKIIAAYEKRKADAEEAAATSGWPKEDTVSCKACGRIILAEHADNNGTCGCATVVPGTVDGGSNN